MNENKLIILEQLPIIKATLENLSVEIKEKVDNATSLVCNEDTIQEVKKTRAELNKEFNELEAERKAVKNAIMSKYEEFETIYKENVSNLYKQADESLKEKIDSVENELKSEKEAELKEFVNQHIESNNLQNIISFEDLGLKVTLSASMKSLKELAKKYIEEISSDIELIKLEEYSDEILLEYKTIFDFSKAKLKVIEKHKRLEELAKAREQLEGRQKQEDKVIEKVEKAIEIEAPKEIIEDEDIVKVQFTIETTKSNIIKLKEFLKENNISYE